MGSRQLGFSECRMYYMQRLLAGTTQCAAALRVRGCLSPAAFSAAVERLRNRHELLNVSVVAGSGELRFHALPEGRPLAIEMRPRHADADWLMALELENSVALDPEVELSRWVLLLPADGQEDVFDILLVAHHAIIDGMGAAALFRQLMAELATPGSTPAGRLMIPPPAEESCPRTVPFERYLSLQAELGQKQPAVPPHRRPAPLSERKTRVRALGLDAAQTRAIAESCEAAGSSFNSYVSACLLRAVQAHSSDRRQFALFTAFSLRAMCSHTLDDDDLGCYLAVIPTFHDFAERLPPATELARSYKSALSAALLRYMALPRSAPTDQLAASIGRLEAMDRFVNDVGYTFTEAALLERYGELTVEHCYVTANRAAGNLAIVVQGLSFAGRSLFTVNSTSPLQDEAWVSRVTASFAQELNAPVG